MVQILAGNLYEILAMGIQFTQRDPSIPVTVQIRGVSTGLPNDTIFAEKVIAPSDEINLGGETKVVFDDPFYAEANTSYAEGVLLESSNAETWTPLNGSDLTMRLG